MSTAERVIRDRQATQQATVDRKTTPLGGGEAAVLGQTTVVDSYPTSANVYFACNPVAVSGTEQEGNAADTTPDTTTLFYAWNAGTQIPPQGTIIVCDAVGGRFVMRYDG